MACNGTRKVCGDCPAKRAIADLRKRSTPQRADVAGLMARAQQAEAQRVARITDRQKLADLRQWATASIPASAPRARSRATQAPAAPVSADGEPSEAEQTLTANVTQRPMDLDEMVGQEELRAQLRIVIAGAELRGHQIPHVLLSGPAGHGKTTLAGIIARATGGKLHQATGIMLRKPVDLAAILLKIGPGDVVFVDEIHRLPTQVMETLYEALEDGELSCVVGSGADATTMTHQLPPFTCVGATTNPGLLTTPFRERFGFHGYVEPYDVAELAEIVHRAWDRAGVVHAEREPMEVAMRCKGVPRLALHLADRVLDYAACHGTEGVPEGTCAEALAAFGIDENGFTKRDWRILDALVNRFSGRTVGLQALAQAIDMDAHTLEEEYEPGLVRAGLVQRTKSGRMALPTAYDLFAPTLVEEAS